MRELRLDKKYDQAAAALKEIEAQPWGKNAQVVKEKLHLLEDQEKYGGKDGAVMGWNALGKQLRPRINSAPSAKELYWECYYHMVYCYYRHAQNMPSGKKRDDEMRKVVGLITQLENSQPDWGGEASRRRFEELLAAEKELRDQYEAAKKGTK